MAYEEIQLKRISVVEPLSDAYRITKRVLFEPFNLEKWFLIGFCAWLAMLTKGGGNGSGGGPGEDAGIPGYEAIKIFIMEHLAPIILIGSAVIVVVVVILLIVNWLSSRGRFMFLDCIVRNYGGVRLPWAEYKTEGNRLFVFKIMIGLLNAVFVILGLAAVGAIAYFIVEAPTDLSTAQMIITFIVLAFSICAFLCAALVIQFTNDFVVPLMYIYRIGCVQAWKQLWQLINCGNVMRFMGYHLFKYVIGIVLGALVVACVLVTCGIACCLMVIPYIGTVVTLPIHVFLRAYSYCYLRQYGREYDVYSIIAETETENPA